MKSLASLLGLALAAAVACGPAAGIAAGAERPLTLDQAVALALEKNEGLVIERESLHAADAAVRGARGAYDPVLNASGTWGRSREPANSSFSGAPAGELAPETRSGDVSVGIRQLLPTGGSLSLSGSGGRATTDNVFARLS